MIFQHSRTKAFLHFEDGSVFEGWINLKESDPRCKTGIWGEAAFTTGMTGYQETITDPSFLGQHIIFSTAHVGNYEATAKGFQSADCHATSLIARDFTQNSFLESLSVPLFSGVDTRALIHFLTRTKVSHKSVILKTPKPPPPYLFEKTPLISSDLERVSSSTVQVLRKGLNPIVVVNYGLKKAICDYLLSLPFPLVSVSAHTKAVDIKKYSPCLILLSNGPGDPRKMSFQIEEVRKMLHIGIPLRAICLGHQLLALALGAKILRLPFGQRGITHPCLEHETGRVLITSQNHGFAVDESSLFPLFRNNSLGRELFVSYRSLFDRSVEGLATTDHFLRSVQFHPEGNPGPKDADSFFEEIRTYLEQKPFSRKVLTSSKLIPVPPLQKNLRKKIPYQRILIIGPGPIKIGQASEFDYSGTQALKALRDIGLDVVLLNSNPATIMTDPEMAFRTYIEPITLENVRKIIVKEKIDAILSTMGGQTALNLCLELEKLGDLTIPILGANQHTIQRTEDRDLFSKELEGLGHKTSKRFEAQNPLEAKKLASSKIGFPFIIRRDFALGGTGALLIKEEKDFEEILKNVDMPFPLIMEKSLLGWKEIELEVMVDSEGNGVIVCSIENIDPCGIHTGDSITVSPVQTISDRCYQKMRTMSLRLARHMGVVAGGANVQFAVHPEDEDEIVVIEMNPRVSRSSALASKATGYPIAKISALLAVGYTLKEILNDITEASPVAFGPTLDYVALKIPIFPFHKFPTSSQILGPSMRSVGEVLALGGSFQEAFFKALRGLEMGLEIPQLSQLKTSPSEIDLSYLKRRLQDPQELSLLTVLEALRKKMSVEEIHDLSGITSWFLERIRDHYLFEEEIKKDPNFLWNLERFKMAKALGFSDKHLAFLTNHEERDIFKFRNKHKIFPIFRAVDTCSGEFEAKTPYFYSTYSYHSSQNNGPLSFAEQRGKTKGSIAIFGSGPNRIGQGIEFDYSCVKACQYLKKKGHFAIMLNSNPETVSTDYDSSDRLYLTPLYSEDLFDILIHEKPEGIIASFAGQTGIGIRSHIEKSFRREFHIFKFLGPSSQVLDLTEDRKLFGEIIREVDLSQTMAMQVQGYEELIKAMKKLDTPVIIRPSYVIGGESMYVFHNDKDIEALPSILREQLFISTSIFRVETYLENALEYDVDLIRDRFGNAIFTVCEHIEYAGVHSGDSGMISPPLALTKTLYQKMKKVSLDISARLEVIGPINFQYAVKEGKIYCLEANPRGSRTLPFLSKAYHLSLPQLATEAMLGGKINSFERATFPYFAVKQSTFPFDRFPQDSILLGPKMKSTGETMGLDSDKEKAILKSYLGNYPRLNQVGKILISLADKDKELLFPYLQTLWRADYQFIATEGTCRYIQQQGIPCEKVRKIREGPPPSILGVLRDQDIRMVFNTPQNTGFSKSDGEFIRHRATQLGIPCFTRKENIKLVMEALIKTKGDDGEFFPYSLQEASEWVR